GELLDGDRVGERVRPGAVPLGRDGDAHEPEVGRLRDQVEREAALAVERLGLRPDLPLRELPDRRAEQAMLVGKIEAQHSDWASSTRSRTPQPEPPFASPSPRSVSMSATPAMSRWAHGPSPANSCRKRAAKQAPPLPAVDALRMSATSERMNRLYVSWSGIRHTCSPPSSPAASMRSTNASSFAKTPACQSPSATTIAPVSVARSTTWVAPWRRAWYRQSARTSRPSASVFVISMVLPLAAVTTSSGRMPVAETRFSTAPTTQTTSIGRPSSAIAAVASSAAAAPDMSNFMPLMLRAGLSE